jgi:hypothetical protein
LTGFRRSGHEESNRVATKFLGGEKKQQVPLVRSPGGKHFHERSAELQIPPLRYASVGMTKGRAALPFRFDAAEDEPQVSELRYAPVETIGGLLTLKASLLLRGTFCIFCLSHRGRDRSGLPSLRIGVARAHRNFRSRRSSSLARARVSSCAEILAPTRRWSLKALAPAPALPAAVRAAQPGPRAHHCPGSSPDRPGEALGPAPGWIRW